MKKWLNPSSYLRPEGELLVGHKNIGSYFLLLSWYSLDIGKGGGKGGTSSSVSDTCWLPRGFRS